MAIAASIKRGGTELKNLKFSVDILEEAYSPMWLFQIAMTRTLWSTSVFLS